MIQGYQLNFPRYRLPDSWCAQLPLNRAGSPVLHTCLVKGRVLPQVSGIMPWYTDLPHVYLILTVHLCSVSNTEERNTYCLDPPCDPPCDHLAHSLSYEVLWPQYCTDAQSLERCVSHRQCLRCPSTCLLIEQLASHALVIVHTPLSCHSTICRLLNKPQLVTKARSNTETCRHSCNCPAQKQA